MANRLQLKRGSGSPSNIFYAGEPIYDQSNKVLYVGDVGGTGTGTGSSIASYATYLSSLEMLIKSSSSDSGSVRFYEDTDNGTNYVAIAASASLASSYTLRLPDGTGNLGQVLQTDGSGNLSWVTSNFIISDGTNTSQINTDNTITFVSGEGIDAVVSQDLDNITITAEAASSVNAGIASYQSSQFYFEQTYKVGVVTATDTVKGIASFDSGDFLVTTGNVTLADSANGAVLAINGTTDEVDVSRTNGTVTIGLPSNVTIGNDLTVNGNLRVVGTAVTFETQTVKVEDRLIELGLINGTTDANTTWDLGVAFNYGDGTAKKSGIFWIDNQYIGIASAISITNDTGNTDADPQITISTFAPIVASGLYLGGFTSSDLAINSSNEAVNLIFDGGSY